MKPRYRKLTPAHPMADDSGWDADEHGPWRCAGCGEDFSEDELDEQNKCADCAERINENT